MVFTSFAGSDPHELLLNTAREYNMSAYFGLPLPPNEYTADGTGHVLERLIVPYFDFLQRILEDHSRRLSQGNKTKETLKGYFWSGDVMLLDVYAKISTDGSMTYSDLFRQIRIKVKENHKVFGLSTFVQANKFERASSLSDYVTAFNFLSTESCADIISIKDGRGSGFDALYWSTQYHAIIETVDNGLYKMLSNNYPAFKLNQTLKTFGDVFSFSINEVRPQK